VLLSVEDQEKFDALCAEYERIQDSDSDEQAEARLEDLSQQIEALEERETYWPPETLAFAGAVVCINDDGELDMRRGLVSPSDAAAHAADGDDADGAADDADDDDVADAGHGLPYSLVESLTTHRTAALWRSVVAFGLCDLGMGCPESRFLQPFGDRIGARTQRPRRSVRSGFHSREEHLGLCR
jgi:hypothetical protein